MSKLFSKLTIALLNLGLAIGPISSSAQALSAGEATKNAQQKAMQQAVEFAERMPTQSTTTLKHTMVGYLESWGTITIEEAIAHHYNVIVIAFGTITGDQVGMNLNCGSSMPEGCFLPSVQWWPEPPEWKTNFKNSVALAHSKGVKVILSFGGAINTFKPGTTTSATLARSIVSYLESLSLDGIDFDLENISTAEFPGNLAERQTYISDLIKQIKLLNNQLIITSAPQINPVSSSTGSIVQFVNTGEETIYNEAIKNNLFDFIYAQAYNTPGFTVDSQCTVLWQNQYDETYPEFISHIAPCLEKLLPSNSKTKIVVGEPANSSDSAGRGALEHGTYTDMANQYNQIKNLKSFGGAMTWSINEDSKSSDDKGPRAPYSFSSALLPILSE